MLTNIAHRYFEMKHISDCRVKCGDRVWDMHKLVICTRSKYFEKSSLRRLHGMDVGLQLYFFNQLISTCQEAKTNVVTLSGGDSTYVADIGHFDAFTRETVNTPKSLRKPLVLLR